MADFIGTGDMARVNSAIARNWAAFFCVVQLPRGEYVEVRNLERGSRVATVMERASVHELHFHGRQLGRDDHAAWSIPRGAVLRAESRKGGCCV